MDRLLNKRIKAEGMSILKEIETGAIATTFFDPQYRGILDKMNYGNEGERQKKRVKLIQMNEQTIENFISEIDRVTKPSGHLFLWIDKFHLVEGVQRWFIGTQFEAVDLIVWDKQTFGMGYRTRRTCEYLLILQKEPKRAKGIWTNHSIRDTWKESILSADKKLHPHIKPINLIKELISATTQEGDIVLDPAAGSFVVADAAISLNRKFITCDIAFGDVEWN